MLLMLHITEMNRTGTMHSAFDWSQCWQRLQHDIASTT